MAGEIVGRTGCPECGFASAHVKRSAKCLYRYCPDCGAQYMATGERRERNLLAQTRPVAPVGGTPIPEPEKTPESAHPAPAPAIPTATGGSGAPAPEAVPPRKRSGLFGL